MEKGDGVGERRGEGKREEESKGKKGIERAKESNCKIKRKRQGNDRMRKVKKEMNRRK